LEKDGIEIKKYHMSLVFDIVIRTATGLVFVFTLFVF